MLSTPTCSVLMAVYNAEKYIATAIASVILQSFTNWELVIIDDGSDDFTYQIASCFTDERIRLFKTFLNKGKTAAMQMGLNQCTGNYILELDADDWIDSNCLSKLVSQMNLQPPDVGMIYGDRTVYKEYKGERYFAKNLKGIVIQDKYEMLKLLQAVGPRFYKHEALIACGGWQVEAWGNGRLYEDVSVILRILEKYRIVSVGYTGYNIRKHDRNITRIYKNKWWETMKRMILYFVEKWGNEVTVIFDERKHQVNFIHHNAVAFNTIKKSSR